MEMQDIPKLYTALAEWLSCGVFLLLLKKRKKGVRLLGILSGGLVSLCVLQVLIGHVFPVGLWIPGMILAGFIMYGILFQSCQISPEEAGLYCVVAFTLAEFSAAFEWQMYSYLLMVSYGVNRYWLELLFLAVFYGGIFGLAYHMEKRMIHREIDVRIRPRQMWGCVALAGVVFLLSNISYVVPNTPFSASFTPNIFYIRSLVDFAGLFMLWNQQGMMSELSLTRELEAVQGILIRQYEQYQQSKENIEVLNLKYHDLKNQISIIRAETNPEKREHYLSEMEQSIHRLEAENKTGNPVLDVILTEKSMNCAKKGIRITSVADGKLLSFLDVMDICTIFGNALDNAMESVEQIEDTQKKLIRLAVFEKKEFLMIRIKNYRRERGRLIMENGLPETTKKDKDYHGYGLKSIKMSVEKYNGNMTVQAEEEWFTLCIMIPFPEGSKGSEGEWQGR